MAFTEFCCRSGGSNLNAGTRTGSSTEPGTSADFTYASGNWVQSTGVFTVASGDPASDGVAVGDFASVYADGSTVTGFVGRVTARSSTTITVSTTAKAGTAPTDGTGTRTLKIGGAWKGPNGTEAFPFNFVTGPLTNSGGDAPRVNLKNDATYSITAAMSHTVIGPTTFKGYSAAYVDGGRATIDGGTSGSSYVLLTCSGNGGDRTWIEDLIFQNNGATGSASGVVCTDPRTVFFRVVVNSVRGTGMAVAAAIECETYSCNQSNTANLAGIVPQDPAIVIRHFSHDNTGGNNSGLYSQGTALLIVEDSVFDSNGLHGAYLNNTSRPKVFKRCDFWSNGGDGFRSITSDAQVHVESCNFLKNGGYGVNGASGTLRGKLLNNGFGAGTQANTSGAKNGTGAMDETGTVNYASDVTPWVDPANGDFRINLAAAEGAGRGSFTQTAASYSGTVGYPDIGAAQHQDAGGGGGGLLAHPGMRGGFA